MWDNYKDILSEIDEIIPLKNYIKYKDILAWIDEIVFF